jgi:hypothetical protein
MHASARLQTKATNTFVNVFFALLDHLVLLLVQRLSKAFFIAETQRLTPSLRPQRRWCP